MSLCLNFFESILKKKLRLIGKISKNPKTSVTNPGMIKSNAANAIAAPYTIS